MKGRSQAWVRMCMRAILTARLEEHALVGPGGAAATLTRFPDLVFSWFQPEESGTPRRAMGAPLKVRDQFE